MTLPDRLRKLKGKASGNQTKQGAALSTKRLYNGSNEAQLSVHLQQQDEQHLWASSRTMAKIIPLLLRMAIICNEFPSSPGSMIKSSSVMPTSDSIIKPASGDTSEFGWQTRIKLGRSDRPQRIQLVCLDQTVQHQPTSDAPDALSHILDEVVNSLWFVIPVEIMIVILASATNCRYAKGLAVIILTPGLSPHGVQGLGSNDTEASFLTNDCTGITTAPKMKLFSMENPPNCKRGSTRYEDAQATKVQIVQLSSSTTVPITNCRIELQFFAGCVDPTP